MEMVYLINGTESGGGGGSDGGGAARPLRSAEGGRCAERRLDGKRRRDGDAQRDGRSGALLRGGLARFAGLPRCVLSRHKRDDADRAQARRWHGLLQGLGQRRPHRGRTMIYPPAAPAQFMIYYMVFREWKH